MANTASANPIQDEIDRLKRMSDKLALTEVSNAMDEVEGLVNELPAKLEAARRGGYVYKRHLEASLKSVTEQWRSQYHRLATELQRQQAALLQESNRIQIQHARGASAGAALSALESRVDTALRGLEAMYQSSLERGRQIKKEIDDVTWTLARGKEVTFDLLTEESWVEAVPANWKKPGDKDGVDGVLFLTDRRLVFEQREEVATKKVLFITTAKEKVQSYQWDLPAGAVTQAVGSKRGFMNKDDFLTLTASTGPYETIELHLKGESGESWRGFIECVKSGAILAERAGG